MFQGHTVFENLELASQGNRGIWRNLFGRLGAAARARIDEVLRLIGLGDEQQRRAGLLAHGQKQWLEIGMLLVQDPSVLLLDEPVAGMTQQETERTAELVTSLARDRTVVVVEHDMEFVRHIARKVTVLHEGRTLAEGPMDEGPARPARDRGLPGDLTCWPQRTINQYYGESHILWDADLQLQPGACTCLMGRNGVGKTTFLKVIMGLQRPSGGLELRRAGAAVGAARAARPPGHRLRAPGPRDLPPARRGGEPAPRPGGAGPQGHHPGARIHALPGAEEDAAPAGRRSFRRPAAAAGHRPRAGPRPQLLILDEPTEGIQPNIVHEIGDVLMRLQREDKMTVLLVEQKLPFARRVADRFVIMDRGRTVAAGAMPELGDELVHKHLSV